MTTSRIPQSFLDDLLSRIDIVSVIEAALPLKKAGANYVASCPFHQEKTPSFTVSATKQFYHCFGCGKSGNAIGFLMDYEHLTFVEAVEKLAKQTGVALPKETVSTTPSDSLQPLYALTEKVAKAYEQNLRQSQEAITYLKSRGVSGETTKRFMIGYAKDSWDFLTQTFKSQEASLLKAGLIIRKDDSRYYDRFRHRVLFPIRDRRGRVIGFGGRVLKSTDTPKYLNSPETALFHKGQELYGLYEAQQANHKMDYMVVVEGYMDVVALSQAGITSVVATLGTAITPMHIQKLFRLTSRVIFCFDGDPAGRMAAWRALEILLPVIRDEWQVQFMFLPSGEDPDTFVQKIGKEEFIQAMNEGKPASQFLLDHVLAEAPCHTLDGRARFASLALTHLRAIQAPLLRDVLLKQISQMTRLDVSVLQKQLTSTANPSAVPKAPVVSTKNKLSPIHKALMLLIQYPALIEAVGGEIDYPKLPETELLIEIIEIIRTYPSLSTGFLLERFRDRPENALLSGLAAYEHLLPEEALSLEFVAVLKQLAALTRDHEIDRLMAQASLGPLKAAERQRLQLLLKEKQNLE